MGEIMFLRTLGLQLSNIKLALNDPFYIKPILINIRMGLLRIEINELNKELSNLQSDLDSYKWREIEIKDKNILNNMTQQYFELENLEKDLLKKGSVTVEDAKVFINLYKNWHRKMGFEILDEHIKLIAFNKNITIGQNRLKEIFQKYFQ